MVGHVYGCVVDAGLGVCACGHACPRASSGAMRDAGARAQWFAGGVTVWLCDDAGRAACHRELPSRASFIGVVSNLSSRAYLPARGRRRYERCVCARTLFHLFPEADAEVARLLRCSGCVTTPAVPRAIASLPSRASFIGIVSNLRSRAYPPARERWRYERCVCARTVFHLRCYGGCATTNGARRRASSVRTTGGGRETRARACARRGMATTTRVCGRTLEKDGVARCCAQR